MPDQVTFSLTDEGHGRIFRPQDSKMWDVNAAAMGTIASVTSANAAVTIPYTTAHKIGLITIPSALPNGNYILAIYNTPAASASDADTAVSTVRFIKNPHYMQFENELRTHYPG